MVFPISLTLRLKLTTATHSAHSQTLTRCYYITRYQYTWTLRWHCMLNCLWVVTVIAKRMLTNAFFLFSYLSRKDSCFSLTRDYISENQYVKITSGYWFGRESWVIRTLLLSQCIESHMATKVPSPIISMTERTALCPPTDSTRKQRTRV